MNAKKLILLSVAISTISCAMDEQGKLNLSKCNETNKIVTMKPDSESPRISKKRRPTKTITSIAPTKTIILEPSEHRIHIENLFTVIPFGNEKKPLSDWLLSKNKAFGQISCLQFSYRESIQRKTIEEEENLLELAQGYSCYYSNCNHQIHIMGIWDGNLMDFKENPKDDFLSMLLAFYLMHERTGKTRITI